MQLQAIAEQLGLTLVGNKELSIESIAPLERAGPNQLTFVSNPKYSSKLSDAEAGAVIVPEKLVSAVRHSALISDNPYLSYAEATQLLCPLPVPPPGIAASASVSAEAQVSELCHIGENAVIGAHAVIADGCYIGPGCVVGESAVIGENCYLHANVTICHDCQLGAACQLQAGAVVGADGFGYARAADGWTAIRQLGKVVIGKRVAIGANTTIDRGALDDTIIADGVILDNQIQVAHNVRIGKNTAIAACVGIAGSTVIGENCTIGGKSAIVGHLNIADNVHLNATSFVTQSIKQAGSYSSGMPLQQTRHWRRTYAQLNRLDDLFRRVKKLGGGNSPG